MHRIENVKYLKPPDDTLQHVTSEIFTYCYYSKFVVTTSRFLTNILKQTFFFKPTAEIRPRYKFKRSIISMTENFVSEFFSRQ